MNFTSILRFRVSLAYTDDLVNIGAFSYSQKRFHPFNAVLDEFDLGKGDDHITSVLSRFYERYYLAEERGFLPVHKGVWHSTRTVFIPPWGGGKTVDPGNDFEHWIGPKSPDQINRFLRYFKGLYMKIRKEGYRPFINRDGLVRVIKLKKGDKVRLLVVGGQKRSSIISHCGYSKVWVRLQYKFKDYPGNMPPVVDLVEVDSWPNVVNGLYTRDDAIAFFNEYFRDDDPAEITKGLVQ